MTPLSRYVVETLVTLLAVVVLCVVLLSALRRVGVGKVGGPLELLALGMQMLNPTQVSLPFKLLLFVAIDGWGLLAQTLVTGYKF